MYSSACFDSPTLTLNELARSPAAARGAATPGLELPLTNLARLVFFSILF